MAPIFGIQLSEQAVQHTKYVADGFSVGMLGAWAVGWLGPVATSVTIFWLGMQIVMNWSKFVAVIKGIKNRKKG